MHTHWHNLIVKEWHAHKWKFASLAAILLATHTWILADATLTGFDSLSNSQEAFTLLTVTSFFCAIPGALFVGMGVAAGERSAGTFAFMRALPAAPWKVAATKLLMASVTVVAPVALAVVLDELWFALAPLALSAGRLSTGGMRLNYVSGFGPFALIGLSGLVASGLAVSVLFWSAVAGARQSSELRAGVAAVGVFAGWAFVTYLLGFLCEAYFWDNDSAWRAFLAAWYVGPAGLTALLSRDPGFFHGPVVVTLQLIALCGLGTWFLYRYAHANISLAESPVKTLPRRGARARGLNPPRRSRLTAVGWQQLRESLPICIGALLPVCVVGAIMCGNFLTYSQETSTAVLSAGVVSGVASSAVWFGVVVGLVVGIGTFVAELQPDLLTFWRSRPISPSLWFWTKYLTGALIILIFLDGPIVLAVGLAAAGWVDVDLVGVVPLVGYLGCAPLLHLLAFSCAVLLVCMVREAVYAGILAVGLLLVVFLAPELVAGLDWLSPQHVMDLMERRSLVERAGVYLPFFGVVLGLSAVATLLAWQAVVRDISIKA